MTFKLYIINNYIEILIYKYILLMSKVNDLVLSELLSSQLKKVDNFKKLSYNDLVRISKHLNSSIFNVKNNDCVLWEGYVTNLNNKSKGVYVNFYYKKKKYALHRLLYLNFIGNLSDDEYLKFSCPNKGVCCNLNHFSKLDKPNEIINNKEKKQEQNKENKNNNNNKDDEKINFIIDFD